MLLFGNNRHARIHVVLKLNLRLFLMPSRISLRKTPNDYM